MLNQVCLIGRLCAEPEMCLTRSQLREYDTSRIGSSQTHLAYD